MDNKEKKPAFTLIELLVVIAIIGLLSTISIVALNQARSKARDTRRIADMHQLVNAIEMYYDQFGEYPPLSDTDSTGLDYSGDGNFMRNLVTAGLLSSDMKDPWNNKNYFYYYWISPSWTYYSVFPSEVKYVLRFPLENDNVDLGGFANECGGNWRSSTTGYLNCIYFY